MPEEPKLLCPDCGKARTERQGSITQWIGLGDTCRCGVQSDLEKTGPRPAGRSNRKCKRCLKSLPRNSMTQWLFRGDICNCPPDPAQPAPEVYTEKALRGLDKSPFAARGENSRIVAFFASGLVCFCLICGYLLLQIFGSHQSEKAVIQRLKGADRTISFSDNNPNLRVPLTNEGLAKIRNLSCDSISIWDSSVTDQELKSLASIHSIVRIALKNCDGFTAEGLIALASLPRLDWLSLEGSEIANDVFQVLGNLHVTRMDLSHTRIRGYPWDVLLNNHSLVMLTIHGVDVSPYNQRLMSQDRFSYQSGRFFR